MTEATPPPDDPESRALAQPGAQAGSLLRLRDVQALNRSFRRLAEVQEALLLQMQQLERERSRLRAWLPAALAAGGVVLGLGLAALAFALWRDGAQPPAIEVQAPPPAAVTVQPAPVTVQSAPDPALQEMVGLLRGHLEDMRAEQGADRRQLAELTERLLVSERERIDALSRIAAPPATVPQEPVAAPAAAPSSAPGPDAEAIPQADADSEDPWLGVLNGLLAVDGYSGLRFLAATRVPGSPQLADVVLTERGESGLVQAVVRAGLAEFDLQHMTGDLTIRLFDGHRAAEGARIALPPEGLRLDLGGLRGESWVEHFPELAPPPSAAEQPPVARPSLTPREAERALDGLLAPPGPYSHYRVRAVGEVAGEALRFVQINWHENGSGRLVRTIEADELRIRLHQSSSSVELELRRGAFLDPSGAKHPFAGDLFRMFLPGQDLNAWRSSGLPCGAPASP